MTVPAPGQDNPQERITVWVCLECGYWRQDKTTGCHLATNPDDPRGRMLGHPLAAVEFVQVAALEAATRERDDYAGYGEILESLTVRAEAAERACEKAIRERRSLEIKEDDWHRAYERSQAALEAARDALRKIAINAEAWHGNESVGTGAHRALIVIGATARSALPASASTENKT